jgi:hypothetical protein
MAEGSLSQSCPSNLLRKRIIKSARASIGQVAGSVYISRLTSVPDWVGPGQSVEKTLGVGSGAPFRAAGYRLHAAESDQNTTIDDTRLTCDATRAMSRVV